LRNKALQRQFILEKRNQEKIQKLKEEEERKKKQFLQKMKHIQDIKDNKKLFKNIVEKTRGFRGRTKTKWFQECRKRRVNSTLFSSSFS
jgi:hypothetical protein